MLVLRVLYIEAHSFAQMVAGVLQPSNALLFMSFVLLLQEHAERAHVVQRLIAEAHMLVQSAQQLEVRLDKDIAKLQVALSFLLPAPHCQYLVLLLAVVIRLLACLQ